MSRFFHKYGKYFKIVIISILILIFALSSALPFLLQSL